ncbi:MAG TPA: nuclear transport factor 2 family protein [Acidobacteriota bacterium]|nr:nuclear transport factor 2 family protein [Acidobacteriota bacterium]
MTKSQFQELFTHLANTWSRRDYAATASVFAENVHYRDPLRYSFHSRAELQAFFEADEGYEQKTTFHTVVFDEEKQVGAAEYTYEGTHRYHGVTIVELKNDLIVSWREYQHIDPRTWDEFVSGRKFQNKK